MVTPDALFTLFGMFAHDFIQNKWNINNIGNFRCFSQPGEKHENLHKHKTNFLVCFPLNTGSEETKTKTKLLIATVCKSHRFLFS